MRERGRTSLSKFLSLVLRHDPGKLGITLHVHLSSTRELATLVGSRRGAPVVLTVNAGAMASVGHEFFCSPNGVWLTGHVPPRFLDRAPRDG